MNVDPPHTLFFDGACNIDGIAAYGWLLYGPDGSLKSSSSGLLFSGKPSTNNMAEFGALEAGLKHLLNQPTKIPYLICKGDSMVVVNQITGTWECRNKDQITESDRLKELLNKVAYEWIIEWIPRKQNNDADRLSKVPYRHLPYTAPTRPKKKVRAKQLNKKKKRKWKDKKKKEDQ